MQTVSSSTTRQILKLQQARLAKRALSGSTFRAMPKGCSKAMIDYLADLSLSDFHSAFSENGFEKHLRSVVGELHEKFRNCNQSPKRRLGTQWGYAAKAVNVFLWEACLHRRLTNAATYKRMLPWLHCPIDRKVQKLLKQDGYKGPIIPIRGLVEKTYCELQNTIKQSAERKGLKRIEYDDLAFVGDAVGCRAT